MIPSKDAGRKKPPTSTLKPSSSLAAARANSFRRRSRAIDLDNSTTNQIGNSPTNQIGNSPIGVEDST
ncbi:hypothetical protein LINGRAHAP2_LOCUS31198 [Linum grandiflorum]